MVVLPFLCVQHRNAWKGLSGKGSQPFPEERDLLRRDAAAAQAALSARSGQSHLEAERLPNGELFKSLTIANFLLFSLLSCQILPTCARLNCPLIAAETTTVRAAGKQRGKEPGEEDDLHQQLVNAEHLLGSHKPRSLLFQLAM